MSFLSYLNNFFLEFSLISYYLDVFLLQFIIIYTLYLFINTSNIYYTLIYLFLQIAYFGLLLSLFQMELFTGFLWVTELTILFIFLILCFYLNSEGYIQKAKNSFLFFFVFIFFCLFFFNNFSYTELNNLLVFNYIDIWDDFYESYDNSLMTDFYGLFLSYYYFNSVFTFFIFLLLFVCSIVCVVLSKISYLSKKQNVGNYLSVFNFFNDLTSYFFYRKQNLNKQTSRIPATKIFKKK